MDKRTRDLMFSSNETRWATPPTLFRTLDTEFNFTLDPCAEAWNAKCTRYFTIDDDGLQQPWVGHSVFVNPPYNKPENACKPKCNKSTCKVRGFHLTERIPGIADWVEKAYQENKQHGIQVVLLLPARTDTKWFHKFIYGTHEVRFIAGRVKFLSPIGATNSAPFPSMVVVMH